MAFSTSMLIPSISKAKQRKACICRQKKCIFVSQQFQSAKDQRGRFVQVPISNATSSNSKVKDVVSFLADRWKEHLVQLRSLQSLGADHRRHFAKPGFKPEPEEEEDTGDGKEKVTKRNLLFVALHHFHPYVISKMMQTEEDGEITFRFRKTIAASIIEEGIPDHEKFGYGSEDKLPGNEDEYVVTPAYPLEMAAEDAHSITSKLSGLQVAEKVIQKQQSSGKKRRAPTEIDEPTKEATRQRIEDDPEAAAEELLELQAAAVATYEAYKDATAKSESSEIANKEKVIEEATFAALTGPNGGYNRLAFVSDTWHELHPDEAERMWSMGTWSETKRWMYALFKLRPPEVTVDLLKRPLTRFERFMLTRYYNEHNVRQSTLGMWYGSVDAGKIIKRTMPIWDKALNIRPANETNNNNINDNDNNNINANTLNNSYDDDDDGLLDHR